MECWSFTWDDHKLHSVFIGKFGMGEIIRTDSVYKTARNNLPDYKLSECLRLRCSEQ